MIPGHGTVVTDPTGAVASRGTVVHVADAGQLSKVTVTFMATPVEGGLELPMTTTAGRA